MKYQSLAIAFSLVLGSCSTGPTQLRDVAVSFTATTPTAGPALLDGAAAPAAQAIVLTSVEIVLREIEMRRSDTSDCDLLGEVLEDECEEFAAGPVLVSVPVDGSVSQEFSLGISEGSYNQIEFDIHKVSSGNAADDLFLLSHESFAGLSIRVRGSFNGVDFVFETDLNVEQELAFFPALQIDAATNITIQVGLNGWFVDAAGQEIDPATGNQGQPNEDLIKENIKTSIEAFEDSNRDGSDDLGS